MKKEQRKYTVSLILLLICLGIATLIIKTQVLAATEYRYLIKVNKQQNCITIYEKDKEGKYTQPVKAMICSTGSATPLGTYNTKVKYRWKLLLDDVWGQYSTRITGSILFHSVWYYKQDPSTLSATQYNKLGTTCSHGCIRLTVEDAKWIYDHCPVGTTVVIYNAKDPGPLGKPTSLKLKAGTGWDPTDPNESNPFNKVLPEISGVKDRTIEFGNKIDLMSGITAISGKGVDLTQSIKVSGEVDTSKEGQYEIKYTVKDCFDQETTVKSIITVNPCPYEVTLKGVSSKVISGDVTVNRTFCLKGVNAYYGKQKMKKSNISVKVKQSGDRYKVTYKAVYDNGQSKSKTVNFYVDSMLPVLNVKHVIYPKGETIDRNYVMKDVTVTDNYTNLILDDIKVSIEELVEGAYLVTYSVSDEAGNTTSETVQFTQEENLMIYGVQNVIVPTDTVVDEDYVLQEITAMDGSNDVTNNIKVSIKEQEGQCYEVTYYIENENEFIEMIAYFTVE